MTFEEVMAEIFPAFAPKTWEHIVGNEGCCEGCNHIMIVLLAYMAWKLEELERRLPGGP